jgi:hypothetical protein
MEMTKLTVRIPQDVLDRAKAYAGEHDTSLSRLIAEYLRHLSPQDELLVGAPTVQRLSGILSPDATVDDCHRYLDEKYEHLASDSH